MKTQDMTTCYVAVLDDSHNAEKTFGVLAAVRNRMFQPTKIEEDVLPGLAGPFQTPSQALQYLKDYSLGHDGTDQSDQAGQGPRASFSPCSSNGA